MAATTSPPKTNNTPSTDSPSRLPPDERFWQRYSPHHEFPLSAVGSFTLHTLAVILVVLGIYVAAKLGLNRNRDPLPVTPVAIPGGGGGSKTGIGKGPGSGVDPKEVGSQKVDDDSKVVQPPVPLADLPPVQLNPDQMPDLRNSPEGQRIIAKGTQALAGLAKLDDKARKDMMEGLVAGKGEGGPGEGGGKGKGKGPRTGDGIGDGPPSGTIDARTKRVLRWTMMFNTRDGQHYLQQLAALDAYVAVQEPDGQYRIYRNLKQRPPKGTVEDLKTISRIFWVDDKPDSVRSLTGAMGLTEVPQHVVAFFSAELEKELLRKELAFKNRKEHEIHETRFQVVRQGNSYVPVVVDQIMVKP